MTDDDGSATTEQQRRVAKMLSAYGFDYAQGLTGFLDDLRSDTPLQVILRGHLWVEAEIVALLSAAMLHPAHFDDRMSFSTRVKLAAALGLLPQSWIPALHQLNAQRNKLAHRLDHQVTEETEAALVQALPHDDNAQVAVAAMGGENAFPNALRGAIYLSVVIVSAARRYVELSGPLRLLFDDTQRAAAIRPGVDGLA